MKVIEVTEKEVKAAFDAAKSDEVKNVLAALFCKPEDRVKPSMDDYKSIKTYEDACEALGEEPVGDLGDHVDKHIIALIKLETISRLSGERTGSLSQIQMVASISIILGSLSTLSLKWIQ